ncbi:MAG TPA: FAD-binding oxidoreductase [Gemmatimonadaceae bacterium]|nr:FAD-binding oxidoreductase [Gemmatimonadaceae bacterium]
MADRIPRRLRVGRLIGTIIVLAVVVLLAYASTFAFAYGDLFRREDPLVREDVARLAPARVHSVERAGDIGHLQRVVKDAISRGLKISISGSRHSQGGHTYTPGGVVLDMRGFNRVRAVDTAALTITVESGATWDEVQRAIAPRGLAIKVMQSSNIFTVGGTLSANAHGRDIDVTQVVEVVERFALLLANGEIVEVSRTSNPELFSLVIGGYGMYGVILDVTLRVTRDELYEQRAVSIDYKEFPRYFAEKIQTDSQVIFMLARPSIDPRASSFLREIVVATWRRAGTDSGAAFTLTEEAHVRRDRFFFGLSRRFAWAKSLRWTLQKRVELGAGERRLVSRNNSMRPPLAPLEFLDYNSGRDTDIIQEYYVPVENFVPFMDRFREILVTGKMNVLSSTVRYVTPNATPTLAYAPTRPVFAIIQMSNVGLSAEAQRHAERVTQQLVDAAIEFGGTYYLTYQLYPTPQQLHRAYPNAQFAFERKRFYDPNEHFVNAFYRKYGQNPSR